MKGKGVGGTWLIWVENRTHSVEPAKRNMKGGGAWEAKAVSRFTPFVGRRDKGGGREFFAKGVYLGGCDGCFALLMFSPDLIIKVEQLTEGRSDIGA